MFGDSRSQHGELLTAVAQNGCIFSAVRRSGDELNYFQVGEPFSKSNHIINTYAHRATSNERPISRSWRYTAMGEKS